jgi:hypothetical protein
MEMIDEKIVVLQKHEFPTEFEYVIFAFVDHVVLLKQEGLLKMLSAEAPRFHVVKPLTGRELGRLSVEATKHVACETPLIVLALCCGDAVSRRASLPPPSWLEEIMTGAEEAGRPTIVLGMLDGATLAVTPANAVRALWTDQSASLSGAAAGASGAMTTPAFVELLNGKRDELLARAKVTLQTAATTLSGRLGALLASDGACKGLREKLETVKANSQACVVQCLAQAKRLEESGRWAYSEPPCSRGRSLDFGSLVSEGGRATAMAQFDAAKRFFDGFASRMAPEEFDGQLRELMEAIGNYTASKMSLVEASRVTDATARAAVAQVGTQQKLAAELSDSEVGSGDSGVNVKKVFDEATAKVFGKFPVLFGRPVEETLVEELFNVVFEETHATLLPAVYRWELKLLAANAVSASEASPAAEACGMGGVGDLVAAFRAALREALGQ